MKRLLIILFTAALTTSCNGQATGSGEKTERTSSKVSKSDAEWRQQLSPMEYEVLRKKGTERPHTGKYNEHFKKGSYVCAGCGNVLFTSQSKFKSSCGWPSFDQAIKGSVNYHQDISFGMSRTEVTCARCGGHLGHVFDDGPEETTGKRYCTNSVSIRFLPDPSASHTDTK